MQMDSINQIILQDLWKRNYMVTAEIVIHSWGKAKDQYEVLDVNILTKRNSFTEGIIEMAEEDLTVYSGIIDATNKKYGPNNIIYEKGYKVLIGLNYETSRDYFGEIDVDSSYDMCLLENNIDIAPYLEEYESER